MTSDQRKLLTLSQRRDASEHTIYDVIVWVPDPRAPKSTGKLIPKGPLLMKLPIRARDSLLDYCFVTSPKKELWMSFRTIMPEFSNLPIPIISRLHVKITTHLHVVSSSEVVREPEVVVRSNYRANTVSVREHALVQPQILEGHNGGKTIYVQAPNSKEWKPVMIESDTWVGFNSHELLLVNPGATFPSISYIYAIFACKNAWFIDSLSLNYFTEWARGDKCQWQSTQVQFPEMHNTLFDIETPHSTHTVVTYDKGSKSYRLYVFFCNFHKPSVVVYFYLSLRSDGSVNTVGDKIQAQGLQLIPTQRSDSSNIFRVEEAYDRVYCIWNQDGRMSGSSAEIGSDGIIKDKWLDFCDESKRPYLSPGSGLGSIAAPVNFCITPENDYVNSGL
ncbi:hypothetical protein FVEN_g6876 [Fusarium venenatum]|uniref:Uncharacterized protein n=1 Tax=Fusarium venenatum TaxID=56646 RepID=A0A2L2TH62_9HYPO|nr:uncharacterized protein FVRRES_00269 [Fusarium venenatum]KAG8355396.1 hypothetical protein FVEN_g6876 [Fusarium venenatum]KAH7006472.1 hypothetical protein EDB82DRAFT_493663 [Fusarium venenatum]CEI63757.1 unnamed protein product [Fusarium venenatum]